MTRAITGHVIAAAALGAALAAAPASAQACTPGWSALAPAGCDGQIETMLQFDDRTGTALYVAGEFASIDGVAASNIARWDGHTWSPVGSGLGAEILSLAIFDAGNGPRLYAGGFYGIVGLSETLAVWDGSSWNEVEGSPYSWVSQLAVSDVAGTHELYATSPIPDYVTRWDGQTWRPVGEGLASVAWDMEVFDDGSGEALYAGGFLSALMAFDGIEWRSVGDSGFVDSTILALQQFDDGSGGALYVGGAFTRVPGIIDAPHVARWDGAAWSTVGDGFDDDVTALAVFDDGSGEALYAAGDFTHSGAAPVSHFARWNGAAWEPVLGGLDGGASEMIPFTGADGRTSLVVAGEFASAGGAPAPSIVAISACPCPADLDGNGVLNLDDINAFAGAFVSGDLLADLDGNGTLNLDDVNRFAIAFVAGCP